MNFDNWKLSTPPSYDYDDGDQCWFCGDPVPDGDKYCNNNCKKGYDADN